MNFSTFVELAPSSLCAQGGGSLVYNHPDFDNILLKVPKKQGRVKFKKRISTLFRPSKRRFGAYREWHTEYEEYLAAIHKMGHCPDFLPRYLGFVNTNLGTAMMVEKSHDAGSENIALTLASFIGGADRGVVTDLLDDFFAKIKRHQIVFRDLHPGNLCVIKDAAGTPVNITCVDGLGDFTLFRVRVWSKLAYNIWHQHERKRLLKVMAG